MSRMEVDGPDGGVLVGLTASCDVVLYANISHARTRLFQNLHINTYLPVTYDERNTLPLT